MRGKCWASKFTKDYQQRKERSSTESGELGWLPSRGGFNWLDVFGLTQQTWTTSRIVQLLLLSWQDLWSQGSSQRRCLGLAFRPTQSIWGPTAGKVTCLLSCEILGVRHKRFRSGVKFIPYLPIPLVYNKWTFYFNTTIFAFQCLVLYFVLFDYYMNKNLYTFSYPSKNIV